MPETIQEMTLEQRLAAVACSSNTSVSHLTALGLEVLASWIANGIPLDSDNNIVRDGGIGFTTVRGVSGVPFTSANQSVSPAAVTSAPTTGEKIVIDDLLISTDTEMSITFTEETTLTIIRGPIYLGENSTTQITLRGKTKLPTINKRLMVQSSVPGNISIEAIYHSEA